MSISPFDFFLYIERDYISWLSYCSHLTRGRRRALLQTPTVRDRPASSHRPRSPSPTAAQTAHRDAAQTCTPPGPGTRSAGPSPRRKGSAGPPTSAAASACCSSTFRRRSPWLRASPSGPGEPSTRSPTSGAFLSAVCVALLAREATRRAWLTSASGSSGLLQLTALVSLQNQYVRPSASSVSRHAEASLAAGSCLGSSTQFCCF